MTCSNSGRTKQMPIKGVLESVVLGFDFSDECTSVLTIVSVIVTVESAAGTPDPNPMAIISGSALVDSVNVAQVNQRIIGGLDGNSYAVQCTVTTNFGDTLSYVSVVPVRQLNN